MNSCEIVSFVTAVSCAIAKCVSREDLPLVAAIFTQIGDTLATINVNEELINPRDNQTSMPPGQPASGSMTPGYPATNNNFNIPLVTDILTIPPIVMP
jgi:hypothetical protein